MSLLLDIKYVFVKQKIIYIYAYNTLLIKQSLILNNYLCTHIIIKILKIFSLKPRR